MRDLSFLEMNKYDERKMVVIQVYSNNKKKVEKLLSGFKSDSSFNVLRETKDSIIFDNNVVVRVSNVNSGARGIRWQFAFIDLESLESFGEMSEELLSQVIIPSGSLYGYIYKDKPEKLSLVDHIYYI